MNVVEKVIVEDCLDGSYIRDYLIDGPVTLRLIERLKGIGNVKYYSDFARPFFTVFKSDTCKIKGVEGNSSLRIVFFNHGKNGVETERRIEALLREEKETSTT